MIVYGQKPVFYSVLVLCGLGLFTLPFFSFQFVRHSVQPLPDIFEASIPIAVTPAGPRISLVVLWNGGYKPYLNNFFTSFRANNDTVELIWVDVGDGEGKANCLDVSPWTGPSGESNIKTICLSRHDCELFL